MTRRMRLWNFMEQRALFVNAGALYRPISEDEKKRLKIHRGAPTHSLEVVMKEHGLDR